MPELVNAKGLAELFGKSKGAVSQWVSSGKLDGCFEGSGRDRRFDVAKCAEALNLRMDLGQRLGNAAGTEAARKRVLADTKPADAKKQAFDGLLKDDDDTRFKLIKTATAEEELRRRRRQNEQEEGRYVLRDEVDREAASLLSGEIAQFEAMLNALARKAADRFGVPFVEVQLLLIACSVIMKYLRN